MTHISPSTLHPGAGMEPSPWSKALPWTLSIWDNTAYQQAVHCWRHFLYAGIRGLRPNVGPWGLAPIDLTFGSLIHDGVDVYTKAVAVGLGAEEATGLALSHTLTASWPVDAERDVFGGFYGSVWQCSDRTRTVTKKGIVRCPWSYKEHLADGSEADDCGQPICPHCRKPASLRLTYLCTEKTKNRRTLARSVVRLCDHLTAGSVRPLTMADGRIGSEYRWFRELSIASPDGSPYLMSGSFDGVASAPGVRTLGPEYKTTRRNPDEAFFSALTMSPQVHTYGWALDGEFGKGSRVMLYVIHVNPQFSEIFQKPVYMSPAALAEWQGELEHYVQEAELRAKLAQDLDARGEDPAAAYPRRLTACNGLPGAPTTPCPFRDFCRQDPTDRERFIADNFHEDRWNPIGVKGAAAQTL
jgi:hypothetical protein